LAAGADAMELAFFVLRDRGDELAGPEVEVFERLNRKQEVIALRYLGDALFAQETSRIELTCQGCSRFTGKWEPYCLREL
jgi:hypothetical protein